jgi:hypothetical protein
MRLRVSAHVRKAHGIFDARDLPRIRIRPPPAFLELNNMIVEQQIDRKRWQ